MKSLIAKVEELDWKVTNTRDCGFTVEKGVTELEFSKYSPVGEDFSFAVSGKNKQEIVNEIKDYASDFDTEEHIKMWIEGKESGTSGIPSIKELVEDADAIKEMLDELAAEF